MTTNNEWPQRPHPDASQLAEALKETREAKTHNWAESKEALLNICEEFLLSYGDGYELAKRLESNHYFDVSRQEMEDLDVVFWLYHRLEKQLQESWVKDNGLAPKAPIGSLVAFEWYINGLTKQKVQGAVVSIKPTGHYIVDISQSVAGYSGKPVVPWEDVELVDEPN